MSLAVATCMSLAVATLQPGRQRTLPATALTQLFGCYKVATKQLLLTEAAVGFPAVWTAACPSGPNRFVGLVTGVRTPDPFTHRRFR